MNAPICKSDLIDDILSNPHKIQSFLRSETYSTKYISSIIQSCLDRLSSDIKVVKEYIEEEESQIKCNDMEEQLEDLEESYDYLNNILMEIE